MPHSAAINLSMSVEEKIHLYRQMARIRRFERTCLLQYNRGQMGGFLILTTGQEGAPVALRSIMGPNDHTITGPRGMGAALASGLTMNAMMAEHFGKTGGCSQGKGGPFSHFNPSENHWGCFAGAAQQTPLALGFNTVPPPAPRSAFLATDL